MRVRELEREPWVATVDWVLEPAECQALIEYAEELGFADAPITTPAGPQRRPEVRNNERVLEDAPERAAWLWERVRPYVPARRGEWTAVGLNERLRWYRYRPGQFFRWHVDGAFRRSPRERSLITLMLYLNEGFRGGTTDFDLIGKVEPETGMALLFDHAVLHQGAPVREGVKYVLRTDVMFRAAR